jgi:rare lipoprotein A (peptidoglycan hydrolase)
MTSGVTNRLRSMAETVSIPATRSSDENPDTASADAGFKDSGEGAGVAGSTLRSTPQRATVTRLVGDVFLVGTVTTLLIVVALAMPPMADARPALPVVTATWYGPGLYGNTTACGQTYTQRIRGVAHRTLPCGTRLTLTRRGRVVRVRVIDRGPFSHATFDLSARTAMDLCRCWRPFTMRVAWKRGWGR